MCLDLCLLQMAQSQHEKVRYYLYYLTLGKTYSVLKPLQMTIQFKLTSSPMLILLKCLFRNCYHNDTDTLNIMQVYNIMQVPFVEVGLNYETKLL